MKAYFNYTEINMRKNQALVLSATGGGDFSPTNLYTTQEVEIWHAILFKPYSISKEIFAAQVDPSLL